MNRPRIVDGGLATALESRGLRLHPTLWSAGVFLEHPAAVRAVHESFLDAGAEILIGASYQMSFEGLAGVGLDEQAAAGAMRRTVAVAREACARRHVGALVAASVGPYGATLGDGSEYRGDHGLAEPALRAFHGPRLEVLRTSGADLLAIETIPSILEARALLELLERGEGIDAWMSFSCRDGTRIADGTPLATAARMLNDCARLIAIGVNCTAPRFVSSLIREIRRSTDKPIVVYPNSGETWNATTRTWDAGDASSRFVESALGWASQGVWAIGGCCRVGPGLIRDLSRALAP